MTGSQRYAWIAGIAVTVGLLFSASAHAQEPVETRPASTTIFGDTGLWFLPTAEVLPARRFSASAYRLDYDRDQGFTDINHFLGTVGVGIGDRVEVFVSMRAVTRIDRDIRPVFTGDEQVGGFAQEYPFVNQGFTGNQVGDLYVGAKFNLMSEYRQQPVALAVRAMFKAPTGDEEHGATTGKPDAIVDFIVSKEVSSSVELTGTAGFIYRGDPDLLDLSNSFTWGFGAGFPTRSPVRVFTEIRGSVHTDDPLVDLIRPDVPLLNVNENDADASVGLQWQSAGGFFVGGGLNYAINVNPRSDFGYSDASGDSLGFEFRLGFHPGVRRYVAPPPPQPPPPPAREPEHVLTVRAACDPCTVNVGETSTVTAMAQDSVNSPLTHRWTAPTGTFLNPAQTQTTWTAPDQEGSVPVTVTVTASVDNRTASDTVTIQVVRPPAREYAFEDVHFDFDRFTLRPEATRVLDEAVTAMSEDASLSLEIEGHTCNIGTAEYNLALGDRRASSVRDYLVSRGISPNRLRTVSYGEERPMHDNSREETRRLNRRAALVVRLQ